MSDEKKEKLPIVAGTRGLELNSLDDMWRFASAVKASKFCPKDFQDEASILIAIEMGMEVGMPAMQSLQNIAVINGRPSIWGDAMLALVLQSGLCKQFQEYPEGVMGKDDYGWVCICQREEFTPIKRKFTIAQAKQAKLWEKRGKDGQSTPWITAPDRMLQMRARGFALRDGFPDVLKGMHMSEIATDDVIDVTPIAENQEPTEQVKEQVDKLKKSRKKPTPEPTPEPMPEPKPASPVDDTEPQSDDQESDEEENAAPGGLF